MGEHPYLRIGRKLTEGLSKKRATEEQQEAMKQAEETFLEMLRISDELHAAFRNVTKPKK